MATSFHVFLSHSSADKPAVEELARRLAKEGIQAWLDKWNLIPGDPWQSAIEKALAESETCAVFVGPSGLGPWQNEEMRAAIDRRVRESARLFRVIPVLLPGAVRAERSSLPTFLVATTWVEFRDSLDDQHAFHRLVCGIRGVEPGPGPGQAIYEGQCPYRGLRVFDVDDAAVFFGREALVQWLLNEVRPATEGQPVNRFLAIVGASGSGKSSVARAGLVAALKRDGVPGSSRWPVAILRPGPDPVESVAVALSRAVNVGQGASALADLIAELQRSEKALHLTTRQSLSENASDMRLVVLVDQFEELFTLCCKEELREALVRNLLYAARVAQGQTLVILTMRADFYAKCAVNAELAAAFSDHHVLVGSMSEDELRRAIERPMQLVGGELERVLVDLLLRDVRNQAGALPLLQHALLELWHKREGRRLTVKTYQEIGKLEGALQRRADAILEALSERERELCRRTFLRLTQPGEGTEDTKRRASIKELLSLADTSTAEESIIQKLANASLLTTEGDLTNRDAFVEVAHEALIRNWPQLRQWIDADRAGLRTRTRLTEAARDWKNGGYDAAYLYTGARLAVAKEWEASHPGELSPDEAEFLVRSLEAQSQREASELKAAQEIARAEAARAEEAERAAQAEAARAEEAERATRAEAARAEEAERATRAEAARAEEAERATRAEAARTEEAERATQAEAARAEEAERAAQAEAAAAKSLRRLAWILAAVAVAAVGGAIFGFWQRNEAENRRHEADVAKAEANDMRNQGDGLINFMLFDLGQKFSAIGRLDILDDVVKKAQDYLQKLSKDVITTSRQHQELAVLLSLGDIYRLRGNLEKALTAYQQNLEIIRRLAKQDPTNRDWQSDLSNSYEKVGDVLRDQGDLVGAFNSYRESLAIREQLAKQEPGNAGWQSDLSNSYEKVGDVLRDQGDLVGALNSYRQSLAIREQLAKQEPGNAGWQSYLSNSYEKVGDVLRDRGDLAGALNSYRQSIAIREQLAKQEPGNAGWQSYLSNSYEKMGDVLRDQGDLAGALNSYRQSLAIREKLAKQDPGNAGWQSDLSNSYERVGDVLRDQGDLVGAFKSYRPSLAIREQLAKQDLGNAGWQRNLSNSYERVGNVLRDQGDLAGALNSYRPSLAIREQLAKQDPGNAGWQSDLSNSYERVGDVLRDQGDLVGAFKSYRPSLAIREQLAKQDPGNAGWQRNLSNSYERVGNVLRDQGDLAGALNSYRPSLAIREKLAKQDPGNAGLHGDLAFSYFQTGTTLARVEPKSKTEAREMLRQAQDILRSLKERIGLTARQQGWLNSIESALHEIGN